MSAPRSTLYTPRSMQWIAVALLLLLFAQTAFTAARTSLTIDEGLHITSGYSILRTGDYRLIEEHPPLVKLLAALPLLPVTDLADPRTLPAWEANNTTPDTVHLVRVMKQWLQPYRPFDRVVYAARVPIMLLSLLLGAVVFRWAADMAGPVAGALALGLYVFDPNIVAHSSVAAIDLGATALIVFASYAIWRAWKRPTRASLLLAGVTLGLAQATKVSALMLLPVFVILTGLRVTTTHDLGLLAGLRISSWAQTTGWGQRLIRQGLLLCVVFVVAGVVLWGCYGFEIKTLPGWSVPLPAASHLVPVERVLNDVSTGRTTFLMGQYSQQGWWYYFPVALAIKTPLPTLILLLTTIMANFKFQISNFKKNINPDWFWNMIALVTFPLVYFASAILQPFNIGYRHLLPSLPFVFVFIAAQVAGRRSQVTSRTTSLSRASLLTHYASRFTFYALLAWYVLSTVSIFPHYLAYFNELAGGPDNGYKWLVDSNLDWGQTWKELKSYMDAHGIARIKFAQFSSNDPATYGIDYEPIAPMTGAPPVLPSRFNPAPGVYVLSASSLQGVPLADINSYDYFRHREPTARVGHALFVYDVQPVLPTPGWVALCTAPTPPLEPADIAEGFGRDDLRAIYFDCTQSAVWPGHSGWIVLPYALAHDKNAFASRWIGQASLSFEQKQSFALPPHSIFLASGEPPSLRDATPLPAQFGQAAELLAYRLDRSTARPGQVVELLTFWRVTGQPPAMLSVMAHLVSADGQAITVSDGLGFTADQWQVGDVFVQRHLFQLPANVPTGALWAQTGLYALDTLQRLPATVNSVPAGDTLRLTSLQIKP